MISNTVLVLTATQRLERLDTWAGFVKVRSTSFTDAFHHLERERFEQLVENERNNVEFNQLQSVSLLFRFNMSVGTQWCIMYAIFLKKRNKQTAASYIWDRFIALFFTPQQEYILFLSQEAILYESIQLITQPSGFGIGSTFSH